MPTSNSPAALPQHIEQLLQDRQQHVAAIATIDATFARVSAALGAKETYQAMSAPAATPVAGKAAPTRGRKRRGSSRFAMTGDESIQAFVRKQGNPTSQDVERHWKSEGRGGAAANSLTRMVQQKKLKRTPLGKGIRGSRYSPA